MLYAYVQEGLNASHSGIVPFVYASSTENTNPQPSLYPAGLRTKLMAVLVLIFASPIDDILIFSTCGAAIKEYVGGFFSSIDDSLVGESAADRPVHYSRDKDGNWYKDYNYPNSEDVPDLNEPTTPIPLPAPIDVKNLPTKDTETDSGDGSSGGGGCSDGH